MVFGKGWQVIMSAAVNSDQGDFARVDRLQFFAVADRKKPIPGAVDDVSMTIHHPDPVIRAQVVT